MIGQMMFIKKWPKTNDNDKYTTFSISQKCPYCKTVVEINSLNDLEYDGYVSYQDICIFTMLDHEYRWNYTCPYCNRNQSISNKNIRYVTRYIDTKNVDIHQHEMMYSLKEKTLIETYDKFEAYWLSAKYGIGVPERLADTEINELFKNNHDIVNKLTNDNGKFVSEKGFKWLYRNHIMTNPLHDEEKNSNTSTKETLESILEETTHSTKLYRVGSCRDNVGRTNICISTNGPYCILLVLDYDGTIKEQRLLQQNMFNAYIQNYLDPI